MASERTKENRQDRPGIKKISIENIEVGSFARNLHKSLTALQMSQSDLAREVWGTKTDSRGYTVAKGRDRVSSYLRGGTRPDPTNLKKIADVLGVTPEKLAPDLVAGSSLTRGDPALSLVAVDSPSRAQSMMHLRVNQIVSSEVAFKIAQLLHGVDGVPDAGSSEGMAP